MFLHRCPVCKCFHNNKDFLCKECNELCQREKFNSYMLRCPVCFRPLVSDKYFCSCNNDKSCFKIYSIYDYSSSFTRRITESWKFSARRELTPLIAREFYQVLQKLNLSPDSVILQPVPCSKAGKKKRKFDQMEDVVSYLHRKYGYKKGNFLKNSNEVEIQQKTLNKELRKQYACKKYQFKEDKKNKDFNKKTILLDDITTTGSTLYACRQILLENKLNVYCALTFMAEL